MHALNPTFELLDTAHVLAVAWNGEVRQGSRLPEGGKSGGARKYKNSGNEAKKYLKINDITFLKAANEACFAHQLTAI